MRPDEAFGIPLESLAQNDLALGDDLVCPVVVEHFGREQSDAAVVVSVLYQVKKTWQQARASWIEPKRSGNCGRYFRVLNWLSENGLSSETCGRLWVLVTPRSANSKATGCVGHE
jgi:hypothetical protein